VTVTEPVSSSSASRGVHWPLFLVPSLIWGTTWLVIKFQLVRVAPEVSVAYRFAIASTLLLAWCLFRGVPLRHDLRTHAEFVVLGIVQFGLNYVLVYLSERYLTSGLLAVIFVTSLVWNLVGGRIFFHDVTPFPVVAGSVLGIVGVTFVFWPEVARFQVAPENAVGLVLAVLASAFSSVGNLLSQRLYIRGVAVVPSTAWCMFYASAAVGLYCAIRGIPFDFDFSLRYLASLAYLVVFGSIAAFLAYLTLLQRVGSGRAGYVSAVIPVLAMLVSTLFEGYRWSVIAVAGMGLVVAGNVMVLRRKQVAVESSVA
jgi:drug/metabolite transporter (DMT)-like permease